MFNLSNVLEVNGVRDFEALHTVSMSPFLEVLLESSSAPIACATAYLALELNAKTMQFVKPIRNGLSVPAHGQVLRVVLGSLILVLRASSIPLKHSGFLGFIAVHFIVSLKLVVVLGLFLPDEILCIHENILQQVILEFQDPCLKVSYIPQSGNLSL